MPNLDWGHFKCLKEHFEDVLASTTTSTKEKAESDDSGKRAFVILR